MGRRLPGIAFRSREFLRLEYEHWLGFVNDFRLMLGTKLGIDDDDWAADFDERDPRYGDLALLHFLTWLEDELVRAGGFDLPRIDPDDA